MENNAKELNVLGSGPQLATQTCIKLDDETETESTQAKQPSPSCITHIYLSQMNDKQVATNPVHIPKDPVFTSTAMRWKSYYDDITNADKLPIEVRPIKQPESIKARTKLTRQDADHPTGDKLDHNKNQVDFEHEQHIPKILLNQNHRVPTFYTGRGSLISKQREQKNTILRDLTEQSNENQSQIKSSDSNTNVQAIVPQQSAPKFYNGKSSWRRNMDLTTTDSQ
jgi:hypothetical protein